jgi:hypothetical protein
VWCCFRLRICRDISLELNGLLFYVLHGMHWERNGSWIWAIIRIDAMIDHEINQYPSLILRDEAISCYVYIPTMHFCTKYEICSAACGADRWGHVVFCFIPFNKGTRETWKIKPGGLPTAKLKRKKTIYIQIETRTIDHRSKKYPSLFKSRIRRYTRVKWLG